MDQNNLKCVVGQVSENQPAIIRFFDSVDRWNVEDFKDEFEWLCNYVKPSKIIVLINSDGGSVIHGMSAFSLIYNCPIETCCVIEGIAASMGSIIWAAGKNLYMHDYSILMIHNPYICSADLDPNTSAMVNAFKEQLRTVYVKRLGLSEEEVISIMDGKEGVDGTYLSAADAVARGIIPADHVIQTSQAAKDQLRAELEAASESHLAVDYQKVIAKTNSIDPKRIIDALGAIEHEANGKSQSNQHTIQMNQEFQTVASLLGLEAATAQLSGVSAKITELMNAQKELELVKNERDDFKGKVLAGETKIANLQASLDKVNAELNGYKKAEEDRKNAEVNAMLDKAIEEGRVKAELKAQWVEFFNNNYALAKQSLDSVQAVTPVTTQIAGDKDAQEQALAKQKEIDEAKKKAEEAVAKVLGDDFQMRKFN